jgi:hypothetical protein
MVEIDKPTGKTLLYGLKLISVIFSLLDYNTDGKVSASDLTVMIQQSTHYQFQIKDIVRVRNDTRRGVLLFLGTVEFASGIWGGVELTSSPGMFRP